MVRICPDVSGLNVAMEASSNRGTFLPAVSDSSSSITSRFFFFLNNIIPGGASGYFSLSAPIVSDNRQHFIFRQNDQSLAKITVFDFFKNDEREICGKQPSLNNIDPTLGVKPFMLGRCNSSLSRDSATYIKIMFQRKRPGN